MKVVLMMKTRGHIILVHQLKEMMEKGYFAEGEARSHSVLGILYC
jgi:hypothetical protein